MASEHERIIARILRVNHSGEHGAVAIYSSQINRAKKKYPEILPWLEETLAHEKQHRQTFLDAMPSRGAKPCRAMYIWRFGGGALGVITALFGKRGVMICTAAVERTVHNHLVQQISYLENTDPALANLTKDILKEEDGHLAEANQRHDPHSHSARALSSIVALLTETLIFLSTRGDSRQLPKAMQALI